MKSVAYKKRVLVGAIVVLLFFITAFTPFVPPLFNLSKQVTQFYVHLLSIPFIAIALAFYLGGTTGDKKENNSTGEGEVS